MSLDAWLHRLAEPGGAPGGGAACGVMLAIAAALLHMAAGYSTDERAVEAGRRAMAGRDDALAAAEADGVRSADLGAALAEPAATAGRDGRLRNAALAAAVSSAELGEI